MDLFQKYNQDIHYVCFILPNIFGKYDTFINNGRIIPSFIKKINEAKKKDIDLIIDSNSYNQVNLIYVEDLFDIILQTLEQEDNNDKHLIQGNVIVFNEEGIFNLEEIINYLKEEMQFEKNILFTKKEPLPLEEKNIMKPDLTKLKSFYNNYTFSDIKIKLKETIDHFYSVETGIL